MRDWPQKAQKTQNQKGANEILSSAGLMPLAVERLDLKTLPQRKRAGVSALHLSQEPLPSKMNSNCMIPAQGIRVVSGKKHKKCDGRHNEVGAPASGIMAGAVLTPWDKDLEPDT
jgi:hypothetical protein